MVVGSFEYHTCNSDIATAISRTKVTNCEHASVYKLTQNSIPFTVIIMVLSELQGLRIATTNFQKINNISGLGSQCNDKRFTKT